MKYKLLRTVSLALLGSLLMTSCIKNNVEDLGSSGSTWIKFLEAPENPIYFTPFSTIDTLDLFSVRKDANSNANLKTATTVTLTSLPAMITAYNTTNGSSFEALPDSLYKLLNTAFTKSGTGYTLAFKEGVAANEFTIALDGKKWDVSHTYALAFKISLTGAEATVLPEQDTIMVFLSVKNKYDAEYTDEGYFYHPSSPRAVSGTKDIKTAGPSSVTVTVADLGGNGYVALITIDEATNKLTITAAPGAGGAPYTMLTSGLPATDPGYSAAWSGSGLCNNTYDPVTRTFYLRYGYQSAGVWRVTEEILTRN
ncbi:MAG: DUF1735 domain-containing protein [Chitinophagaceae bacterium]